MRPETRRFGFALTLCLVVLSWTACDTFLEPDPASFSTTANFYETPGQFEQAINGAYSQWRAMVGDDNYRNMADLRGPNLTRHFDVNLPHTVAGIPQLDEWTMTVDNGQAAGIWVNLFELVKETNVILGRIEEVEFPDAQLKDRITGEARVLRAFAYWAGAQFYGEMPLILEEVRTPAQAVPEDGRRPVAEVYNQVIADLQDAVGRLPASYSGRDVGRVTQGAARMLLGRTYLLTGDYASALREFEAIDASGQYQLLSGYRDIFSPGNKNNAESILEIQYNPTIPGQPSQNQLLADVIPFNSSGLAPPSINPRGVFLPTPDFIRSYEEGDMRKDESIAWWVQEGNSDFAEIAFGDSLPILNKFYFPEYASNVTGYNTNIVVFRFADVLLSAAEAHWRQGNQGQAIAYLNRVRERAGLPGVDLANYSGSVTGSPLGDAVLHERSVELFGEAHNWLDLLRFGSDVAINAMRRHGEEFRQRDPKVDNTYYVIEDFKLLYPIDPVEVVLGNYTQNPGWR